MNAIISAIKFLKKLFCIDGKSPAILTNIFINAKQNADEIIHIIPFTLLLLIFTPTVINCYHFRYFYSVNRG